ncbi:hypothetical protein BVX94_02250 [bacterium B17]|nr:hypothetical protein BVX94_02250 [bacterium B17]
MKLADFLYQFWKRSYTLGCELPSRNLFQLRNCQDEKQVEPHERREENEILAGSPPLELNWECPHCRHTLEFCSADEYEAKLAMVSHLATSHGLRYWQVVGTVKGVHQAAEDYFDGKFW